MEGSTESDLRQFITENFPLCHSFLGFQKLSSALSLREIKEGFFIVLYLPPRGDSNLGHWNVIFKNNHAIEHFDSLGFDSSRHSIICRAAKKEKVELKTSGICVQSPHSDLCGQFCMYFIYNRVLHPEVDLELFFSAIFPSLPFDEAVKRLLVRPPSAK